MTVQWKPATDAAARVFPDGGELGALCRAKDWSAHPLGPVDGWPQSLKTAVSMVLGSQFPLIVLWGPQLYQFYNDGYRLLMGTKHPGGLGQGNKECWPEVWHINETIYPRIFNGETVTYEERMYPLAPHGYPEEYFLTLCYSPVRDETGAVGGVLVSIFDVTREVRARNERDRALAEARAERERLYEVFMQAPAVIAVLEGPEHCFTVSNPLYQQLTGNRDLIGKPLREALPEIGDQGFLQLLDNVRSTGKPYIAHDALVRLDRKGTGAVEDVYVDFVYQPLKDASGSVFGIMAHAVETTEQVLARRSIEALAAERVAMLGHIADAVITFDTAGRVSFINEMARTLYPGLRVGEPFAAQGFRQERVDGTPLSADELPPARAGRGERVLNEVWNIHTSDGHRQRVQGSAVPVYTDTRVHLGVVLTLRDITQQHRLEQQLELERNRLTQVFMQAPASIMVARGPQHVIQVVNPGYDQMTGNRPLVGKTIPDAFPDLAGQGLFELYDQVYATKQPFVGNEVPVRVARFGRVDDAYFNFVYQPLIDEDGETFGVMTHAVEVTDMVRSRQQAEERTRELVRLTQALEQSNRELDQFAYVASHDLKAPLRGIANLAEWLKEELGSNLTVEAREFITLLHGRVHRMEALIDGILTYSRAGKLSDPAAVDTGALLKEVVELLAPPPEAEVKVQPGSPTVSAERVKLQQVFLNLIGNALKFTRLHRPDPRIQVTWRDAGEQYEFTVADNGPGIAPEFHERIWGIFQTLESRDKVEGTGIGLSVVRKIIETRGGRAWVDSVPGEGAAFRFTWPKT
ncbi:PAS/PAC sensor signal transduction histidine kinase [Corallococcus coralloides DSM 2259]|uniref:histidine kinase n=1 Tax=Corallococcus coralloides (strain ATCC 25202 / DSM 2259 / NBRC 100086 / M2) TaxID=1144275 RepID=H8MI32_CORCM|nr:PAS domain-containing protein [Corallococcus coralloides]AFE08416.1 PAS/PAC sensor signal transduction histidine kinase [Corallococcus coralloides DSM 2259]